MPSLHLHITLFFVYFFFSSLFVLCLFCVCLYFFILFFPFFLSLLALFLFALVSHWDGRARRIVKSMLPSPGPFGPLNASSSH
jgi:hypothetical protein